MPTRHLRTPVRFQPLLEDISRRRSLTSHLHSAIPSRQTRLQPLGIIVPNPTVRPSHTDGYCSARAPTRSLISDGKFMIRRRSSLPTNFSNSLPLIPPMAQ